MVKLQFPVSLLLPDFSFLLFGVGARQIPTIYTPSFAQVGLGYLVPLLRGKWQELWSPAG